VRWGTARRDCAPHRGNVLLLLAWVAWALELSSFCLVVTGWAGYRRGGSGRGGPKATSAPLAAVAVAVV
jgi:hypothetical protein